MGGKQSFIKVVSLPYPFNLNAVNFMVASGSLASPTTSPALTPSASWWCQGRQFRLLPRQGRQLRLLLRQDRQLCLLPRQGHQFCLLPRYGCQLRLLPRRGCQLCLLLRQLCLLLRQLRRSKNILINCPSFRSRHVSGRVRNTKACVVIVEY